MIRFMPSSDGSIGRTPVGTKTFKRTFRTSALMRIFGRRAPGPIKPRAWQRGNVNGQTIAIATPLSEVAKSKEHPLKFQSVANAERQQLAQRAQAVTQFRDQRQQLERQAADLPAARSREFQPAKVKLLASPIASRPNNQLGKDHIPPERHEVLKPDLTIAPTARNTGGKAASIPGDPRRATARRYATAPADAADRAETGIQGFIARTTEQQSARLAAGKVSRRLERTAARQIERQSTGPASGKGPRRSEEQIQMRTALRRESRSRS